jgi:general stress protein YciG
MPLEQRARQRGGFRRAIVLSDEELSEIGRKGANSRWGGLNEQERKAERARGREPWPRCPCGKYPIGTARCLKHKCQAPPVRPSAEAPTQEALA